MRLIFLSTAALITALAAAPAIAADLSARAPVPYSVAANTWGGFYIGLHAGGAWTNAPARQRFSHHAGAIPGDPAHDQDGGSRVMSLGGAQGGIQAGYNFDVGNRFVLGLEADFAYSGLSGAQTPYGLIPVFNGRYGFAQNMKTDWQATVRGRVGYSVFDSLLVYATGGVAFTNLNYASNFADDFAEYEFFRLKAARTGWTIGGGFEYAISNNWSAKLEYLHTEYASAAGYGTTLLNDGTTALARHSTGRLAVDSVKVGVNYRFTTSAPAPVIARY